MLWFMSDKESDTTEQLNWTELKETKELYTENYDTDELNQEIYSMFLGRDEPIYRAGIEKQM